VHEHPIDFYITQGKTYTTKRRMALVVNRIGTDDATGGRLHIHTFDTGDLKSLVAPLHKTSSNLLGPLDLKTLPYVIPPRTDFYWDGSSGAKARLIGKLILLEPGEDLPTELYDRYASQHRHYLTYVEGTKAKGTDEAMADGEEITVLTISAETNERYRLIGPVMVDVDNYTPSEGELVLRFKYDRTYLDELTDTTNMTGIDVKNCPRPPTDTDEMVVFSFEKSPITVEPGHKLYVIVKNVSGSSISPAAGTALSFTVTAIVEYELLE